MKKKVVTIEITKCSECPYLLTNTGNFRLEPKYKRCKITHLVLDEAWGPIPSSCPLDDAEE